MGKRKRECELNQREASSADPPFSSPPQPTVLQVGVHSQATGSAYVELGDTKAMAAW